MPKRRDAIRMTEEEIWAFVAAQKNVHLATISQDGTPHLTTLWFALDGQDIILETFTKSQKIKNLERDPRLTVMLEGGKVYEELKGVVINGQAQLYQDVETVHRLHMAVLRRNTDFDEKTLDAASASMAPKKTAIVVKPEKIISWDHSKLDVSY